LPPLLGVLQPLCGGDRGNGGDTGGDGGKNVQPAGGVVQGKEAQKAFNNFRKLTENDNKKTLE